MDEFKVEKFLKGLSGDDRKIASVIIENTIHIDDNYMFELLNKALDEFELLVPKYNLFIPDNKIGSEHYLISKVCHRLKPSKCFYGTIPDNDYPILIIDDAIYSSCNMCSIIDELMEKGMSEKKFYCVVAITSSVNCDVKKMFAADIIAGLNLEHLTVEKLIPDYSSDRMYNLFGCETYCVLPVFFDHKIANAFGSYQFYYRVIKKPIDRSPINIITEDDIQKIADSFKVNIF
uniref:Uncharacterized protein n=1 Tax=Pithovirus LCPAC403 TaxID=2506596 RepID=A0A481ZCA6_9VIRU|nr:MAG: uncharacterized protein LCPAC403_01060 [Pithovirus LCPAC403]